jgi:hypothetical protein
MSIYAPLLFLFLFGTLQCMVATTAAISEGVHAPEFCKGRRGVASVQSPLMLVDYISVPTLSACRYPPPKPLYFRLTAPPDATATSLHCCHAPPVPPRLHHRLLCLAQSEMLSAFGFHRLIRSSSRFVGRLVTRYSSSATGRALSVSCCAAQCHARMNRKYYYAGLDCGQSGQ